MKSPDVVNVYKDCDIVYSTGGWDPVKDIDEGSRFVTTLQFKMTSYKPNESYKVVTRLAY